MKNYFFLLSIVSFLLFSCGKKNGGPNTSGSNDSTQQNNVKVDSLAFEVDTFHVIEKQTKCNDKAGECASCDLYYEKIRTPLKPVHDSVNRYVDSLMMRALGEMSSPKPGLDLKKRAQEFIEVSQDPDFAEFGTWDWTHTTSITRPVNELISVSSGWGGYTGGAHGNYYSETTNFFTSNGKMVTMADLFNDIAAVNKLAVSYFKKDNQLEADVDLMDQGWDLSDEDFKLNENFDITSGGITWQFNSYEIGSYANGAPSVTIPMKDLEKYLKVKFTDVVI